MKLGLLLPTMQSLDVNRAALAAAEHVGVDGVWVVDHVLGLTHPEIWPRFPAARALPDPDALLDPFCVSASLGPTTNMPIGTCVTDATRRRGGDLARTALTLHDACQGGFILGIGSGEAETIAPFGYEYDKPVGKRREGAPRDSLDARPRTHAGWCRSDGSPAGRSQGRPSGVGWCPAPADAAADRHLCRRLAASAQRRRPLSRAVRGDQSGRCRRRPAYASRVAGAGHDLRRLARAGAPDARGTADRALLPAETWRKYGLEHPGGPDCRGQVDIIPHAIAPEGLIAIAEEIPVELVEELVWLGNADEIAEQIAPYAEVGATHLMLGDVTGTTYAPAEAGRVLGEQLPRLKTLRDRL